MAKLSIILPSYNHSAFLTDRLESISNQTYKDWEAIIIDDKSTDNSVQIITDFLNSNPDFNVRYFIVNESNSGSGYFSWQKGIELAETEFIWIAETDDYSEPSFLEELVNILELNDTASLAFCGSKYVENGTVIYDSANRTKDLNTPEGEYRIIHKEVFLNSMPFDTFITNGSSVVFRKPETEIPAVLFQNKLCSDIFLWSYLVQNNSFAFLNKNLNFFRRHEGSTSSYLQKNKLENVYHEKAGYLNYFGQTEKYGQFIDHYIKNYVWTNKKEFLNTSSIQEIQSDKKLTGLYFYKLVQFIISKILNK
ncbi:glycosyltransferase [Flavobacterium cupreum]|uniref:Glycosyltransferase n=1 Tax=Flavobacterium cupreum TaxID=2133766 RepID=A0A434A7R0_9FLAO|nr:glycosyltransferase family 2 protein [Flavobacterium cupreum]RUT70386.1 glycosyltransferase [Flavobacterium cupreum]